MTGTAWTALIGTGNGLTGSEYVAALAVRPNGDLVIGGSFDNLGTATVANVGLWNGSAFFAMGPGTNGTVHALAVRSDGTVYVGGAFSQAGGAPASNLARWTGSGWQAMGVGVNANVYAIHIATSSEIYVGGNLFAAGATSARGIVRTNPNGGSFTPLADGLHADLYPISNLPSVYTILRVDAGTLLAGGNFTSSGSKQLRAIARWNGGSWSSFWSGVSAAVRAITVEPDGNTLLAGWFTGTPSGAANHVARWNGTAFSSLGAGADGPVYAVQRLNNGDVMIAGSFLNAGSVPAARVARFNGLTWSAMGSGVLESESNPYKAIAQLPVGAPAVLNLNIFVGGAIDGYAPSTYTEDINLLAYNGAGAFGWHPLHGLWNNSLLPFDAGFVAALAPTSSGDLIVAGSFDNVGGDLISACIGRWKPATYSFESIGSGFNPATDSIYALLILPNGDIVAAGDFEETGGAPGNAIARWNGTQWLPFGTGIVGDVFALTRAANGDIIAGGTFTSAGGVPVNNIARWNSTSWSALGDGVRNSVYALATHPSGEILVGGAFARAGGKVSAHFARWSDTGVTRILTQPQSDAINCNLESPEFNITVAPGYNPTYQWYFNGAPINADGKHEIDVFPEGSRLRINPLFLYSNDAGDYHVVVSTTCGSITSDVATLTITGNCPPPCPGDFDGSGFVDDTDCVTFASAYNILDCTDPSMDEGCPADINDDGFVDDADFVLFAEAYNQLLCP